MGSWGASDADEAKPKFLTTEEAKGVYATASGWTAAAGGTDDASADREVLVAIRGLSTLLNKADITGIEWITTAADKSAGFTLSVRVRFNEAVTVTGTPRVAVTNGNQGSGSGRGPHQLAYASGSGSHALVFSLVIAAANAATNANDVLSIGANAMNLNSGTIKDTGTNVASTITNSGAIGTAAGTITVVA